MAKRKHKTEFSQKVRKRIRVRDGNRCIFCQKGYRMDKVTGPGEIMLEIMHFVPRSAGGLGIEQNGAIGCRIHHTMLDNGNEGKREEMIGIFREYLKGFYPDWQEEKLHFDKWAFLKGE